LQQYPALLHQIITRDFVSGAVVFGTCVSLGNGLARVAGLLALGSGLGKRQVRSKECNTLIRTACRGFERLFTSSWADARRAPETTWFRLPLPQAIDGDVG
jgi:hypothetical protein